MLIGFPTSEMAGSRHGKARAISAISFRHSNYHNDAVYIDDDAADVGGAVGVMTIEWKKEDEKKEGS